MVILTKPIQSVIRAYRSDPHSRRRQIFFVTVAWLFGSYWLWTIAGATMTQYAKAVNTPEWGFGLLAALPFIGTLAQVPASFVLERYGNRRMIFLVFATISRLMWTVAALVPFLIPGAEQWWWQAMALCILLSQILGMASVPAWMNWMSDLIPRKIRGRYFARRNQVVIPVSIGVTFLTGYLVDHAIDLTGILGIAEDNAILYMTSALIAIAGIIGVIDILCFTQVYDPDPPKPKKDHAFLASLAEPFRDPRFRPYLCFNFFFILGTGFMGQYLLVYLIDVAGLSNFNIQVFVFAIPMALGLITYRIWGKLIDRFGKKPIMNLCCFGTIFGSLGWLLVHDEHIMPGYLLVLAVVIVWPGLEISSFNFLLDASTSHKSKDDPSDKRSSGTAYVAVNSVVVGIGGILSGFLGSYFANRYQFETFAMPAIDLTLSYHGMLFIISAALRFIAWLFVFQFKEPDATGTRDAIRYMTTSLYSNVTQAIFLPSRMVGRTLKWSYRINRIHRRINRK